MLFLQIVGIGADRNRVHRHHHGCSGAPTSALALTTITQAEFAFIDELRNCVT